MIIGTIALLAFLMHGAGAQSWPALAQEQVSHVVKDDARREKAEAILGRMLTAMNSHLESVVECRKELLAVETRYESTAEDFRAAYANLEKIWRATEDDLLKLRFELRDHLTRAEWDALCDRVDEEQDDDDDERDDD